MLSASLGAQSTLSSSLQSVNNNCELKASTRYTGGATAAAVVRTRLDVRRCGVLASVSRLLPAATALLGFLKPCCGATALAGSLSCTQVWPQS